ncbi:MAG: COX15/CtaA family protein [Myxococcales bacterium]
MASTAESRAHRLALATAAATFLLVIAGGLVWATESALACPDWPLCHGQAFPHLAGRVLFEVSHRYVAGTVAVLAAVLAWLCFRAGGRGRAASLVALGLVLAQAVLGGLTVILKLPLVVRVAHLATSQAFFAAVLWTVFATREPPAPAGPTRAGVRGLAGLAALAVYAQLLLGAFVRHTGAALACNASVFSCNGSLWPAEQEGYGAIGPAQVVTLHKAFALLVGALVVAAAVRALRSAPAGSLTRKLAWAASALVAAQILLGALSVLSYLAVPLVTAHLATGSLLFAAVLSLWFSLGELGAAEATAPVTLPAPLAGDRLSSAAG